MISGCFNDRKRDETGAAVASSFLLPEDVVHKPDSLSREPCLPPWLPQTVQIQLCPYLPRNRDFTQILNYANGAEDWRRGHGECVLSRLWQLSGSGEMDIRWRAVFWLSQLWVGGRGWGGAMDLGWQVGFDCRSYPGRMDPDGFAMAVRFWLSGLRGSEGGVERGWISVGGRVMAQTGGTEKVCGRGSDP